MGTVYLIHFDKAIGNPDNPRGQARHYLGYSSRPVTKRLREHELGRAGAARIMQVVQVLGVHWRLARTWEGTFATERKLKDYHNNPRLCPICREEHT